MKRGATQFRLRGLTLRRLLLEAKKPRKPEVRAQYSAEIARRERERPCSTS